jgi:hypothetical protein
MYERQARPSTISRDAFDANGPGIHPPEILPDLLFDGRAACLPHCTITSTEFAVSSRPSLAGLVTIRRRPPVPSLNSANAPISDDLVQSYCDQESDRRHAVPPEFESEVIQQNNSANSDESDAWTRTPSGTAPWSREVSQKPPFPFILK